MDVYGSYRNNFNDIGTWKNIKRTRETRKTENGKVDAMRSYYTMFW